MGGKLLLVTCMKSHMGLRFVPKLVSLNDVIAMCFALFRPIP